MKILISVISLMTLAGCGAALLTGCAAALPEMFKTIDDIATDDAITVAVDRDAIKKDTDVHIIVDVINKDTKEATAK